ncbi:acid protease, partial [Meredithblackwellia eburnea MCA 4105]
SGEDKGFLTTDIVTLSTFTQTQNFVACDNNVDLTSSKDQTGLMGLAWESLAATNSTPFVENLWKSGLLQYPMFGFALATISGVESTNAETVSSGGYFTIGALNHTLYTGDIQWFTITNTGYWSLDLANIGVAGSNLGVSANDVVMDTGTNSILVSTSVAQLIYSKISGAGAIQSSPGLYGYPCDAKISFALEFGGSTFTMNDANFNWGKYDTTNNLCVGAVTSLSTSLGSNTPFIIGTPFLSAFYTGWRFSPPAVGLAAINDANGVLDKSPIPSSHGSSGDATGGVGDGSGNGTTTNQNVSSGGGGSSTNSGGGGNSTSNAIKNWFSNMTTQKYVIVVVVGLAVLFVLLSIVYRCCCAASARRRGKAGKGVGARPVNTVAQPLLAAPGAPTQPMMGQYQPPPYPQQEYNNPYDPAPPLGYGEGYGYRR